MRNRAPVTCVSARFEDLVTRGLRALIAEEVHIELVADDIPQDELELVLEEHAPAVAILNLSSMNSPAELARLHGAFPGTRLVVLAERPTPAACNQLLAFGATACLSKDTQARDILNAIHLASRGLHVIPTTTASPTARDGQGPELLTRREAEVLELLQEGRTNAQIAMALHVGIETVRTHARNIYRKLGVRTRRDLVRLSEPASGL